MSRVLDGKTAVITGASSGIGAAAAQALSELGARVIVVGRSPERTAAVAKAVGGAAVLVDFADLASVRRAAAEILRLAPKIDMLANNAGGSWPQRELTTDGLEQVFQVNHLAPFLLTQLLHPALAKAHGRIINTSSALNTVGHVELDDLETSKIRFRPMRVYGTTKLENIYHAQELARRWAEEGITAASFHPGLVATEFGRNGLLTRLAYRFGAHLMKTSAQGADTLVWLATTEPGKEWVSGGYYSDRRPGKTNPQLRSEPEIGAGLWKASEALLNRL